MHTNTSPPPSSRSLARAKFNFLDFSRVSPTLFQKDEEVVNIESLEFVEQQQTNAKVESSNDAEDKASASDLRAEPGEYPVEWNFSMSIPKSEYRPPVEIPAEASGRGVNRCAYFVCSDLSRDDWIELPPASPHQINVARRIKKFLTGNLDASITSYPPFPGTERHYLSAIIARISASTHISPRNFYRAEDDDFSDDDDDGEADACLSEFSPSRDLNYIFSIEKLWKRANEHRFG
jgi:Radial spokehead-like protein